ncbi:MAG: bifunctional riboflavin kinase/FAD synthetase [Bacilli bacterium]|nr:bifunctional riboflavin kinase/FAD synthetase [Bacilli bacterium]
MEIIQFRLGDKLDSYPDLVLCLGFFDGVHLGHQSLIKKARKEGYKLGVLSFNSSPAYVMGYKTSDMCITSISDKADLFEDMGVDYFFIMDFDKEVMKATKDEFIDKVLLPINPTQVVCGPDYRFGVRAEGDPTYLKRYFNVKVIDFENYQNQKISSRNIIDLIKSGKMEIVTEMLGRPYRINGTVMVGLKNGKKIEFPTANLSLEYEYIYPKVGVYIGYGIVFGRKYKAIINVGTHPTVSPLSQPIIEVHLLDFDENLYGKNIFVEFVRYIRDEMKFENLEELKKQLNKDKQKAKKLLQ